LQVFPNVLYQLGFLHYSSCEAVNFCEVYFIKTIYEGLYKYFL